jgi:hypothetical protein
MGLLFTYALTYGGALVALVSPFYGLLIYISFAILRPEELWPWSVPAGSYSQTVAIALLIGWACCGFGSWNLGRGGAIVWSLCGFLLWSCLSAFLSLDSVVAWSCVSDLSKIVIPILVGVTVIDSPERLNKVVWIIVLSVGYRALRETEVYLQGGLPEGDNLTAHSIAIGAPIAFVAGVHAQRALGKVIAFAAAALCAHAPMVHMSRGAMIGVVVGGVMTVIVIQKTGRNLLYLGGAALVGLILAGPGVIAEFSSSFSGEGQRDASAESRFELWADMWSEVQSSPLVGVGPRCWPLVAERYGWPPGKEGHNLWMQVASEFGIPGVALLASAYAIAVYRLFSAAIGRRYRSIPWIRPFAQIAVTAIPAFAAEQVFGSFYLMELPYYVLMVAAVSLCLASRAERIELREPIR